VKEGPNFIPDPVKVMLVFPIPKVMNPMDATKISEI
jgi:hypothetical protein